MRDTLTLKVPSFGHFDIGPVLGHAMPAHPCGALAVIALTTPDEREFSVELDTGYYFGVKDEGLDETLRLHLLRRRVEMLLGALRTVRDDEWWGGYFDGLPCIVLSSSLGARHWPDTLAHELAHHYLRLLTPRWHSETAANAARVPLAPLAREILKTRFTGVARQEDFNDFVSQFLRSGAAR